MYVFRGFGTWMARFRKKKIEFKSGNLCLRGPERWVPDAAVFRACNALASYLFTHDLRDGDGSKENNVFFD